jgi:hypothetical protein
MPDPKKGETVETVSDDFEYESLQDKADDITFTNKVYGSTSDSAVEDSLNTADAKVRRAYLKAAQVAESGKSVGYPESKAAGGMVDELGYMHGGMAHGKRDPIKYASGGAVRGKRFVGTF